MKMQLILLLIDIGFIFSSLPNYGASETVASPPRGLPRESRTTPTTRQSESPSLLPDHGVSPTSHSYSRKKHSNLGRKPPDNSFNSSVPPNRSLAKAKNRVQGPAASPLTSFYMHHHSRRKFRNSPTEPSYPIFSPAYSPRVPSGSPFQSPSPSPMSSRLPAPAPSPTSLSNNFNIPVLSPSNSPLGSSMKKKKNALPSVFTLPPSPPNEDCASVTCTEPLTYTPPGTPCGCVRPIEVKIRLGVAIYTFFSSVSELAEEVADSIRINHNQVRIVGADAASEQVEKTTVLINLVPEGLKFNDITAFSIYQKFWHRKVYIKASVFGSYEVLYVHYPGLPPSPPSASSSNSALDDGLDPGNRNPGSAIKPLGVDVPRRKKEGFSGNMITVIVLSSFTAFVVCVGISCILLLKCRAHTYQPEQVSVADASPTKPTGTAGSITFGSGPGSASMSFRSGTLTYTGSAKTFSLKVIERATNNFAASRILGEGGFGLVYSGVLDDGREVAVKVLKRDHQHGGREFLAEVEMLSRLHHRNLIKLIGICTEEHYRCLAYELVPNGSVESHLHGIDKDTDPLDWDARMKIALGAARGLAYLHEDSNPRVIHRDFKSSNILLEHDFTPKVSDFGLARTALEEGNIHISTHVMGTFGYLAPEYAMTGHLLVKSDVYSYGVVLLELVTGKKPVDFSLPPGQENLVTWARPLLTCKEGLETLIDPNISSQVSFDSVAKVAAIASMCVQPEVSHRPFMGEVVQALKLVCNEFDETKGFGSRSCSQDEEFINVESQYRNVSGEIVDVAESCHDSKIAALSKSDLLSASVGIEGQENESFRRYSFSSGPLRSGRRRNFWERLRSLSRGSMSEHGFSSSKF